MPSSYEFLTYLSNSYLHVYFPDWIPIDFYTAMYFDERFKEPLVKEKKTKEKKSSSRINHVIRTLAKRLLAIHRKLKVKETPTKWKRKRQEN